MMREGKGGRMREMEFGDCRDFFPTTLRERERKGDREEERDIEIVREAPAEIKARHVVYYRERVPSRDEALNWEDRSEREEMNEVFSDENDGEKGLSEMRFSAPKREEEERSESVRDRGNKKGKKMRGKGERVERGGRRKRRGNKRWRRRKREGREGEGGREKEGGRKREGERERQNENRLRAARGRDRG
ncbi:hypothetical protein Tco_1231136 [Tanacetum coccineum]